MFTRTNSTNTRISSSSSKQKVLILELVLVLVNYSLRFTWICNFFFKTIYKFGDIEVQKVKNKIRIARNLEFLFQLDTFLTSQLNF